MRVVVGMSSETGLPLAEPDSDAGFDARESSVRVICQSLALVRREGFKSVLPCGDGGFNGPAFRSKGGLAIGSAGSCCGCCLGCCSRRWPESDDVGVDGAFVRSAAFASHLSDGSRRRGDIAVTSLAAPPTLTRASCCTTTGAASAKSTTKSIRRIRECTLYHRIFVGYVTLIRRGDSGRSIKSKEGTQSKRNEKWATNWRRSLIEMKEKVHALSSTR
jgi:hypothetical protein